MIALAFISSGSKSRPAEQNSVNSTESLEIRDKRLKAPITMVYSRRKSKINSHEPSIDPETGNAINTQKIDSHDDSEFPIAVKKRLLPQIETCVTHQVPKYVRELLTEVKVLKSEQFQYFGSCQEP